MCGGASSALPPVSLFLGLSPRVRGSRLVFHRHRREDRSIPACAGEPSSGAFDFSAYQVYPRVCGGACFVWGNTEQTIGLSPRVRGSRNFGSLRRESQRSIPACAGEPVSFMLFALPSKVYPRVCGGAESALLVSSMFEGLSPRVRGSRNRSDTRAIYPWSIPACAGEPE